MGKTVTDPSKSEETPEVPKNENKKLARRRPEVHTVEATPPAYPYDENGRLVSQKVQRDKNGRFTWGHGYLPITQDGIRNAARKAFLDGLNGIAGEKRLLRIAEIAEGYATGTIIGKNGEPVEVTPSIREQLDANTTLLYLQHGRPSMQVDVTANHTVKVRWNPDKYARVEDLEKYLELQRVGEEVIDAEVVEKTEGEE